MHQATFICYIILGWYFLVSIEERYRSFKAWKLAFSIWVSATFGGIVFMGFFLGGFIGDVQEGTINPMCGYENVSQVLGDEYGYQIILADIWGKCRAFTYIGEKIIVIDEKKIGFWEAYFHEICHQENDDTKNSLEEELGCIAMGKWNSMFAPKPNIWEVYE